MLPIKRIDYTDANTQLAIRMGLLGFAARFIATRTGMSQARVYYRLKKARVRIRDYRYGRSRISEFVMSHVQSQLERQVKERIRPLLRGK